MGIVHEKEEDAFSPPLADEIWERLERWQVRLVENSGARNGVGKFPGTPLASRLLVQTLALVSASTTTFEPSAHLRKLGNPPGNRPQLLDPFVRSVASKVIGAYLTSQFGPFGWAAARYLRRKLEAPAAPASALNGPDAIGPQLPEAAPANGGEPRRAEVPAYSPCPYPPRYSLAGPSVSVLVVKSQPVWLAQARPQGDRRLLRALARFATMAGHAQRIDHLAGMELALRALRQSPSAVRRALVISVYPIPASPRLDALLEIARQEGIALALLSLEPSTSDPLAATAGISTTAGPLSAMLEQQLPSPASAGEVVLVLESSTAMREVAHGQPRARLVADALRAHWTRPAA